MLKTILRPFLIALQFLTIIPFRISETPDKNDLGKSVLYYPLVGLLIGLILAGLNATLQQAPELLRAALLLISWVIITGVLHLDGLADSADAWLGGLGDRKRTLAIMKDPCCGPAAVVALVSVMMLKFTALIEIESGMELAIIPVLGRLMIPLLFLTTPYVRKGGLGAEMADSLPRQAVLFSVMVILICVPFIIGTKSVFLIAALIILFLFLRHNMIKRIGGTTGDTAGAMVELTETAGLVFLALL